MLDGRARFDDDALAFDLDRPPRDDILAGRYHLISKSYPRAGEDGGEERSIFLYRLSHPLGEHVVDGAKTLETPPARIVFDVTHHPTRVHVIEALRSKSGYLTLTRLVVDSYEREEYLLFSGFDETGSSLDQETMESYSAASAARTAVTRSRPQWHSASPPKRSATPRRQSAGRLSRTACTSTRRARNWSSGLTTWCSRRKRRCGTPRS
jgi:hypothetical protein